MKYWNNLEKHTDERGMLQDLLPKGAVIKSVLYCTGVKGAVRGSHMHHKDKHYCYVVAGKIRYTWMDAIDGITSSIDLVSGDCVLSEIGEYHKFEFLEDGVFIAMATEARTQENYEHDTIRKDF